MINGIVKTENGFSVKDFESGKVIFEIGSQKFPSYMDAVESCRGKYYPDSFFQYLAKAAELGGEVTDIVMENMIYDGDPRGVWDSWNKEWRSSRSMMHGAASDEEVAYLDALCFTYESLNAMTE